MILLEHPPVITLGRRAEEGELHIPEDGFRYYSPFAGYPDGFYWIYFSYKRGVISPGTPDGWYLFFP